MITWKSNCLSAAAILCCLATPIMSVSSCAISALDSSSVPDMILPMPSLCGKPRRTSPDSALGSNLLRMLESVPIGRMAAFSVGKVTREQLDELLAGINAQRS